MSDKTTPRDDFEDYLRRIRVADPPPELRQRILDRCRPEARATTAAGRAAAWWSLRSWRPELALCAAIFVGLCVLIPLRTAGTAETRAAFRAAETTDAAETARRLSRSLGQGELTAQYLTAQLATSRRVLELESMRRVRDNVRSLKGLSPWS